MFSVVVPVYRNRAFIPALMDELGRISDVIVERYGCPVEVVFVVDACPEGSYGALEDVLPSAGFRSQLILHSRNFGSFAAIRTGLAAARGDYYGIIAADLQEPPHLLCRFMEVLHSDQCDVAIGRRDGRDDPIRSATASSVFWWVYRKLIDRQVPAGGVDVFGCNRKFRDELLRMDEANSSLVGLVFWLGFRRCEVGYHRRARAHGDSGWTFSKKLAYLSDSILAFTALPIRWLFAVGLIGVAAASALSLIVILGRLFGAITVPGYAPIILAILFFGGLNLVGLSIVGAYAWRGYENTKRRPFAVIGNARAYDGGQGKAQVDDGPPDV